MASGIKPENNPLHGIEFEEMFTNPQLYLCGQPVKKLLRERFFDKLNIYVQCGFCYTQAALAMFLLHDDPSARIVQGWARGTRDDEMHRHAWVEFKRDGQRYVIDYAWLPWEVVPIPRDWYYDPCFIEASPLWICGHREFWQNECTQRNYECLSDPKTSWLFPEMLFAYQPKLISPEDDTSVGFNLLDFEYIDQPWYGKIMIPQVFPYTDDGGLINQRVIKELMHPQTVEVSSRTKWRAEHQYRRISKKIDLGDF